MPPWSRHIIFLSVFFLTAQGQATEPGITLRIEFTVRNDKGEIGCSLYATRTGWPDSPDIAARSFWLAAQKGTMACVYENLPPGTYAGCLFHDENSNHHFDKSRIGYPKEGWASTNNVTHAFSGPTFEESKFFLGTESRTINVKMHY